MPHLPRGSWLWFALLYFSASCGRNPSGCTVGASAPTWEAAGALVFA